MTDTKLPDDENDPKPKPRRPRRPRQPDRSHLRDVTDEILDEMDPTHGAIWSDTRTLWPGTDYIDGILYMTIPMMRTEQVSVGKGKNQHYEEEQNKRTMCLTSESEAFWYDKETVARHGFSFPDTMVQERDSRWPLDDAQAFMNGRGELVDPAALWNEIHEAIFEHVEYGDDFWYDITTYYVMLSYVFRIFQTVGYLHFNGTAASGKSQNLRLLQLLGFNATWASHISPASLYRQVAGAPGLMCIDEIESFESEAGQAIHGMLKAGYTHPGNVTRSEQQASGKWTIVQYPSYSPKALASINTLEPVLAERCLIVPMTPAVRAIKFLSMTDSKWPLIRAKLYRWAMQNAFNISEIHDRLQVETQADEASPLRDRAWEIAMPFVVLGEHISGPAEVRRLTDIFAGVFERQRRSWEDTDRQRLLLKLLPRVIDLKPHIDHDGKTWWRIKDIHDTVAEYLDEDAREYYKSKQTGRHLTTLGWTEKKPRRGGTMVAITEDEVREQFTKRHVDPLDEDIAWMKGEISYVERARAARGPDPDNGFGWGDDDADDAKAPDR